MKKALPISIYERHDGKWRVNECVNPNSFKTLRGAHSCALRIIRDRAKRGDSLVSRIVWVTRTNAGWRKAVDLNIIHRP